MSANQSTSQSSGGNLWRACSLILLLLTSASSDGKTEKARHEQNAANEELARIQRAAAENEIRPVLVVSAGRLNIALQQHGPSRSVALPPQFNDPRPRCHDKIIGGLPIKNVGKGSATNIALSWEFGNMVINDMVPSPTALAGGDESAIYFPDYDFFASALDGKPEVCGKLTVRFNDINGKESITKFDFLITGLCDLPLPHVHIEIIPRELLPDYSGRWSD